MNERDLEQFTKLLNDEAQFYPSVGSLTSGKVLGYFESLSRFGLSAIQKVMATLRERSEFFPTIRAIVAEAEGSTTDHAEVAWHTFFSLLSEGEYPSIWVYDNAMAYAIDSLGGWLMIVREMREASIEMIANFEKRFKSAYKIARERQNVIPGRIHFAGQIEIDNRQNGSQMARWSGRTLAKTINIQFCVVSTAKYRKLDIPFDTATMQINAGARAALESRGEALQAYLPARTVQQRPALPAAAEDEQITAFERKQLIKQMQEKIKQMAGAKVMPAAFEPNQFDSQKAGEVIQLRNPEDVKEAV